MEPLEGAQRLRGLAAVEHDRAPAGFVAESGQGPRVPIDDPPVDDDQPDRLRPIAPEGFEGLTERLSKSNWI